MNYKSIKIIFLSYFAVILVGMLLLRLPAATTGGITLIDALFTSTSATCVTGLIVKDTQFDFTFFGQTVIALLIQIGGFGYMSLVTLLAMIVGRRLEFQDRMIVKENFDYPTTAGVVRFLRQVFIFVVVIEMIGALLLSVRFSFDYSLKHALWLGVFHSISAFNNAGFSLFDTGLVAYRGDFFINLIICVLIVMGGLGFFVLVELKNKYRHKNAVLSLHTKVVLWGTLFLIVAGAFMVLSFEWRNPKTLGDLGFFEKLLVSVFTSINYRTSGFNTIDISGMKDTTLFFSTLFMIIGGAPGSTAGGIKITTVFVLMLGAYYSLKNSGEPVVFKKTITADTSMKALAIVMFSSAYIWLSLMVISEAENLHFLKILFEVTSAFGTVGLSTGDGGVLSASALFGNLSKVVIILLMFMGRVGVLAFTLVLVGKSTQRKVKYPEGKILL